MPKRKSPEEGEDEIVSVKGERLDFPKKRAYNRVVTEKKVTKPWDERELALLWQGIYRLTKENMPQLALIPELKENGRTASRLHNKVDAIFKELMKAAK